MSGTISVLLHQFNAVVGDIEGNAAEIINGIEEARRRGARILLAPELCLTGYPPEDLLFRPILGSMITDACSKIADAAGSQLTVFFGAPTEGNKNSVENLPDDTSVNSRALYNSCLILNGGIWEPEYHKQALPNYQVFDEKRYFLPGREARVVNIDGLKIALLVCEDIWVSSIFWQAVQAGADVIFIINASPFSEGKSEERLALLKSRVIESGTALIYVNLVGGQDDLVFDGGSICLDYDGSVIGQAPFFEPFSLLVSIGKKRIFANYLAFVPDKNEMLYQALVTSLRDYLKKTGFEKIILGLSGGIDSAVTLAIAASVVSPENIHAVMMPYSYTAGISVEDAQKQANNLGVKFSIMPINPVVDCFFEVLSSDFDGIKVDITEENLQSRTRGVLLMALSNKFGSLVLTTGNKSEMAVGYSTLYGDMAGGFSVLKDLWKTRVYELARHINSRQSYEIIPSRVLYRPPTAELSENQLDSDSLPPYGILDKVLAMYIEKDMCPKEISEEGFEIDVVLKICKLVDGSEYKRRQSAIGTRVTGRGFGRDRRYPIANRWTSS